jgi:hypothetical protein
VGYPTIAADVETTRMAKAIAEYDLKTDSKKRVTLRRPYEYYHATEYDDGRIVLEPRVLRAPESISRLTLAHMDEAMRSMAAGIVGDEFDLSEVQHLIDEP